MENASVTIVIITFNEEIMLPFTIDHYRKMFKNPKFVIWDNHSTDQTISIAEKEGCEINYFSTDGMNDTRQSEIKSRAAMECTTDWCICIDADELCFVTDYDLLSTKSNIIQFQGWDIFQNVQSPWLALPEGCRSAGYSKPCCIKVNEFSTIKFAAGAHAIESIIAKSGFTAKWSKDEFNLLHYKHWSPEWVVSRSAFLASRQSDENKKKGHSYHFAFSKEKHLEWWNEHYNLREVIQEPRLKLKEEIVNLNNDGSITINNA